MPNNTPTEASHAGSPPTAYTASVTIASDHRYYDFGDAGLYTDLAFAYSYWADYLNRYRSCSVLARVIPSSGTPDASLVRADGPGVEFITAPNFIGPVEFLFNLPTLLRVSWAVAKQAEVSIIRNGGIATAYWFTLRLQKKPYGKEVQGEFLTSAMIWSRNRPPVSRIISSGAAHVANTATRLQARKAAAVAYVSPHLAGHYPASTPDHQFVFSSATLEAALQVRIDRPARYDLSRSLRIIAVGRLELEKGPDVLLEALAKVRSIPWILHFIGSGSQRAMLQRQAVRLGISDKVVFRGALPPGPNVLHELREADLFVLPSRTEGMPRALLEAMAAGTPAIAASVGGVPLLLPPEQLFNPDDPQDTFRVLDHFVRHAVPVDAGRTGRRTAERLYGKEVMTQAKEAYHRRLIAESSRLAFDAS